jgi:hypothetical protein
LCSAVGPSGMSDGQWGCRLQERATRGDAAVTQSGATLSFQLGCGVNIITRRYSSDAKFPSAHRARKGSPMTPSPRPFSTISVAAIVLSATLSVLLPPDRSFAQSSPRTTLGVTASSNTSLPPLVLIACNRQEMVVCKSGCERAVRGREPSERYNCRKMCQERYGC